MLFGDVYRGRRVLITGHTGFKGSWLALWLGQLGAEVSGIALDPDTSPSHWDALRLDIADHRHDIRDAGKLHEIVDAARPEIIFHLAAQPLVRRSYRDPLANWSTNVMGTANVLDAARLTPGIAAIIAVTTDKVYANQEWQWGYRENDVLGGDDPYSASKAACELLIRSYRKSFFTAPASPALASARAGNVIGGGDWAQDRLVPDIVKAVANAKPLVIRSPHSTRPWQHVLESAAGYLRLGEKLLAGQREFAQAWNFGPGVEGNRQVAEILSLWQQRWPALKWQVTAQTQPAEATLLQLDATKARTALGWSPVWGLEQAIAATADWYKAFVEDGVATSREQLGQYVEDARAAGASWARS
jgi:CDP-glucose 4,6-dehydratase